MKANIQEKFIAPIAMPGTHERFLEFFKKQQISQDKQILDLGAGHGAFTQRLFQMGYAVSACDLFPDHFQFEEIECKRVDITETFPYPDQSFDIVIAIEVSEHVPDHEYFFHEINRILKTGGKLYLSTPNILSLKSRIRFFFTGFYYSFNPLEMNNYDGLQHVASLTLDQYNYLAVKHGFQQAKLEIDRKQKSSSWLYILFYPLIFLHNRLKSFSGIHNTQKLLLGRLLFLCFEKLRPDS